MPTGVEAFSCDFGVKRPVRDVCGTGAGAGAAAANGDEPPIAGAAAKGDAADGAAAANGEADEAAAANGEAAGGGEALNGDPPGVAGAKGESVAGAKACCGAASDIIAKGLATGAAGASCLIAKGLAADVSDAGLMENGEAPGVAGAPGAAKPGDTAAKGLIGNACEGAAADSFGAAI